MAQKHRKEISSVKTISASSCTNFNFRPAFSTRDLERELRRLESKTTIQRNELRDLTLAYAKRDFRQEFFETLQSGYLASLGELNSEINQVRAMLHEGGCAELTQ
jgi:hypothetical protein